MTEDEARAEVSAALDEGPDPQLVDSLLDRLVAIVMKQRTGMMFDISCGVSGSGGAGSAIARVLDISESRRHELAVTLGAPPSLPWETLLARVADLVKASPGELGLDMYEAEKQRKILAAALNRPADETWGAIRDRVIVAVSEVNRLRDTVETMAEERARTEDLLTAAAGLPRVAAITAITARIASGRSAQNSLKEIGDALRVYSTNPAEILTAITTLQEVNARLTSEHASALATDRKAHAETVTGIHTDRRVHDEFLRDCYEALRLWRVTPPRVAIGDPWAATKAYRDDILTTIRGVVAEAIRLRKENEELGEVRVKLEGRSGIVCTVCNRTGVLLDCSECDLCEDCHTRHGCGSDEDDVETDDVDVAAIARVFESLGTALSLAGGPTSGRGAAHSWCYAILVDWPDVEISNAAQRYGWGPEVVAKLRDLRATVVEVCR